MKSTVLLCVLALAACSQKAPEPQATPPKHEAAGTGTPGTETPWDGLKKDEQRARDVQKTVDQQAAEQRREIEAAGQ